MEDKGREVIFSVFSARTEYVFVVTEFDTVGYLKKKIAKETGIPNSKLVLTGWILPPDGDDDILRMCADLENINNLIAQERNWVNSPERHPTNREDLELAACVNFIKEVVNNFSDNTITFHIDLLSNKITQYCLGPIEQRKVILLYLHNREDEFSTIFWRNLQRPEVSTILTRQFCIIGWDLSEKKCHSALINALHSNQLDHIAPYIERNIGAAICLVTDVLDGMEIVNVFSCMRKETSDSDFLNCLENAVSCHIKSETVLQDENATENLINSTTIQQSFANMLGNRDYDSYEFNQHEYLKKNIAYAICGPPTDEGGYSEKVNKEVEKLFKKILEKSNEVAEYKDKIEIATIYNCTEPLPKVKAKKLKKKPNYKPNEDIIPFPVFILRKCRGSKKPCRIFIDHMGRVYGTWNEYLTDNKLPECVMIVPTDGRYEVDDNENVILDEPRLSPTCDIGTKILNGLDIASAVGGVTSGGLGVTTAVLSSTAVASPLIVAALPAVGVGALVTGIVAGGYSMVRSGMAIHDRVKREEPMGFFESAEARGAYLNIIAGGLCFVGAGTNILVSQLVSQGVQIGTSARVAVNAINVINLGAGGVGMANSIGDVIYQYAMHNEKPSALTILQLTSNILFFGHAVFNFKTASTIIDETQARVLKDYNDSLRSNRHRKTFSKILKSTIKQNEGNSVKGKAEVISALRNIQNKDETFAALTRNMSKLNKEGIKVFAQDGQIKFNGINIDMAEFCSVKGGEVNSFLTRLPVQTDVTPSEMSKMQNVFKTNGITMTDITLGDLAKCAAIFLKPYENNIKEKIIKALSQLINSTIVQPIIEVLTNYMPKNNVYVEMLQLVLKFFAQQAQQLEGQYQKWKHTKSEADYNPLFDHLNIENTKRYIDLMQKAVMYAFKLNHLTEDALRHLIGYVFDWFVQKYNDYEEAAKCKQERISHSAKEHFKPIKVDCSLCGGHYFQNKS